MLCLFQTQAFASFDKTQFDVGCISTKKIQETIFFTNNSRSTVILFPEKHSDHINSCRIDSNGVEPKPIQPGKFKGFYFICDLTSQKDKTHFNKSTHVNIHTIKPDGKTEITESVQITARGLLDSTCTEKVVTEYTPTLKAECPTFRIDDPPEPMSRVKVRDQRANGTCYAAAATAMFDYMRASNGEAVSDPASSLGAALDYKSYLDQNPNRGPKTLDGGWDFDLLEMLIKDGACPHSKIAENLRLSQSSENQLNEIYSIFTDKLNTLKAELKIKKSEMKESIDIKELNQCIKKFQNGLSLDLKGLDRCPSQPFLHLADSIVKVDPTYICINTLVALQDQFKMQCTEEERIRLHQSWESNTIDEKSPALRKAVIDKVFFNSKEKHPVMISIDGCMIQNFDPKLSHEDFLKSKACVDGGLHAVIIVGQVWNSAQNRCEAIVKNSWGKINCDSYPGWDCTQARGTFNIDKDLLIKGMKYITTIQKKP